MSGSLPNKGTSEGPVLSSYRRCYLEDVISAGVSSELLVQCGHGVNLLPVLGGTDRSWTAIHEGLNDCMVDTSLWIMLVSEIKPSC